MLCVIPHSGILGVVWFLMELLLVDRRLWVPWLVSRNLGIPFASYIPPPGIHRSG